MKASVQLSCSDQKVFGTMLNALLADQFAVGTRMRNCRWTAPDLPGHGLNEIFASHTRTLDGILDDMAEQARLVGNGRMAALAVFLKQARSRVQPGEHPPASQITTTLLAGHEAVMDQLRANLDDEARRCANFGVVALFEKFLEKHEHMASDLRAVLEEAGPNEENLCAS